MDFNKNSTEDIYNVDKYTDKELYNILDLINPTDRELEAKINNMIWKYANIGGESGNKLADFFKDIYERFFEIDEIEAKQQEYKAEKTKEKVSTRLDDTNIIQENGDEEEEETVVEYTKPLDYTKGSLNPLLQQTTKRIVSIDSQYRDNKAALSTDFTFNLSDPLRDVLNLKLYSIQIPYTWYTINSNYGSNFFMLKGNSSGINNGFHDIKISIPIGNYTAQELITAVNLSLTNIKTDASYSDTAFGDTEMVYDYAKSKGTMNFDIVKQYNENQYTFRFSKWTSPNIADQVDLSIPGFLGFNYINYTGYTVQSILTVMPLTTSTDAAAEINLSNYSLTTNNNYFNIINYISTLPTDEYVDVSNNATIVTNIRIELSGLITGTTYSRNELFNSLNNQLQSNNNLLNISKISRIDSPDASGSIIGKGKSHFDMEIRVNRFNTFQSPNSKICVVFPDDTSIWTGPQSAFVFQNRFNELSNSVSETIVQENRISVTTNPKLTFTCTKANYNNSYNNYVVNISNNDYLISELITEINNKIIETNTASINIDNGLGVFKTTNSLGFIDNADDLFKLRVDLTKTFTEKNYLVNLLGGALDINNFIFGPQVLTDSSSRYNDLSQINLLTEGSIIYGKIISSGEGYKIYENSTYFTLTARSATGISTSVVHSINTYGTRELFNIEDADGRYYRSFLFQQDADLPLLENEINNAINSYTYNGEAIFSGTNVSIIKSGLSASIVLTINARTSLTQSDYILTFSDDHSSSQVTDGSFNTDASNVWANDLKIGQPDYNLNNPLYDIAGVSYSQIVSSGTVSGSSININSENNIIYIEPVSDTANDSIATEDNANVLTVVLTLGTYTRDQLIAEINSKLSSSTTSAGVTLASGSFVSVFKKGTNSYSRIRLNINKTYRANDYRVVFYDPFSFVTYKIGPNIITSTTWDATLGWVLGFRISTEYFLSDYTSSTSNAFVRSITGDNVVSINIYNYFMIILDDYNQNHLNDGVVTTSQKESNFSNPSYFVSSSTRANPTDGTGLTSTIKKNGQNMTKNEIYAAQSILNAKSSATSSAVISTNSSLSARTVQYYSSGPFAKSVFALIPLKISGLRNNQTFVEFGGTLQQQQRTYFGPVNINRMTVKLMNDKGELVDLNGANWSFSFICEQLYQQKKT